MLADNVQLHQIAVHRNVTEHREMKGNYKPSTGIILEETILRQFNVIAFMICCTHAIFNTDTAFISKV